jgi:hypothetical protein
MTSVLREINRPAAEQTGVAWLHVVHNPADGLSRGWTTAGDGDMLSGRRLKGHTVRFRIETNRCQEGMPSSAGGSNIGVVRLEIGSTPPFTSGSGKRDSAPPNPKTNRQCTSTFSSASCLPRFPTPEIPGIHFWYDLARALLYHNTASWRVGACKRN